MSVRLLLHEPLKMIFAKPLLQRFSKRRSYFLLLTQGVDDGSIYLHKNI